MKGDISLAGLLISAEDWAALDSEYRADLLAAASSPTDPWIVGPLTGVLSGPIVMLVTDEHVT